MYKSGMVIVCLFFLNACASYGSNFDMSRVDDIQKGVTTESEVITFIGKPTGISRTSEGDKILTYIYTSTQVKGATFIPIVGAFAGGADVSTKMLQVWIDNTGIVSRYLMNESGSTVNNGAPAS